MRLASAGFQLYTALLRECLFVNDLEATNPIKEVDRPSCESKETGRTKFRSAPNGKLDELTTIAMILVVLFDE